MNLSTYQQAIKDWFLNSSTNGIVDAKAGSGKTSTMVMLAELMPGSERYSRASALAIAFNKHIAEELGSRMGSHVTSSTLNSFGWRLLGRNLGYVKLDKDKTWWQIRNVVTRKEDQWAIRKCAERIVSLGKSMFILSGRELLERMDEILEIHDIITPEKIVGWWELIAAIYDACLKTRNVMDFDDQIFMPLFLGMDFPRFDIVFADEAQDFNMVQIEFIKKLMDQGARVVAFGDPNQAIYGFRGADHLAMEKLRADTDATVLPLSICYRCSKEVVRAAQQIVPAIEYSDSAPEGEVLDISPEQYKAWIEEGDWILCRTTAPLVADCMEMIRKGRKATVKGRDIGQGIITLIETITSGPSTPRDELIESLEIYSNEQREKNKYNEAKLQSIEDQYETVVALSDGCLTARDIVGRVEQIFSDNISGIMFCTIHRSKGLETNRVFIIHPELLPHPSAKKEWQQVQEANLEYVAITRAKQSLYWVG